MSKTMKTARTALKSSIAGVSPLVLTNCAQLSHMATEDIVTLSKHATTRFIVEGERIFEQGERADAVYILLDGGIRLERSTEEGLAVDQTVEIAYATFGDIVLLGEEDRRYDATAIRETVAIELPLEAVQEAIESNSPQGVAWRGSIMARLHRFEPQDADSFSWRILERLSQLTAA
ncbi:MAG: cyclic nucleotide-binding domain-containing protein [Acidobacteria bacterium]|nr:cyclic nucleotide-binding domain-containing protein [Acidobacteriota bacterium]